MIVIISESNINLAISKNSIVSVFFDNLRDSEFLNIMSILQEMIIRVIFKKKFLKYFVIEIFENLRKYV